tara:strand:- start:5995 stop:7203 length:1209 start_codon:yes stop_codon:yes gene_type:complete
MRGLFKENSHLRKYISSFKMIRAKNQEKFDGYVKSLWSFLKDVTKSNQRDTKDLNYFLIQRRRKTDAVELMTEILRNVSPYIDEISRRDEFIFTPEFGNAKSKPLQFFPGFDFRRIWKYRNLTNAQKRIIFRYLEFLYIQASLALGKNKDKVNEIVESIKMEQEIAREAEENPDAFGDAPAGSGDFNSLFGDDDTLMDLVNDLKDEFNLEETFGEMLSGVQLQPGQNPLAALQNISSNPQMANMMQTMAERVQKKMQEKGITEQDLMKSAENLKKNLGKNVSAMPGGAQINKMLKNFDIEKLASQMQQNNNPNMPGSDGPSLSDILSQANASSNSNGQAPIQNPADMMQQLLGQLNVNPDGEQMQLPPELQQAFSQMQQNLNQNQESNNNESNNKEDLDSLD